MENATDALKIAFAVIVFTLALGIAITMFSQLNQVSKIVISSSDVTNYYEYEEANSNLKSRIVGLETIIPTLYKYYKENFTVLFLKADNTPLGLYNTKTVKKLWGTGSTLDDNLEQSQRNIGKYYSDGSNSNWVCTFDVDEETYRHEPWTGSNNNYKENLKAFLEGGTFNFPNGLNSYDYSKSFTSKSFIAQYSNSKFEEILGEYNYSLSSDNTNENLSNSLSKNKKKRVIIYKLLQ